MRCRFSSDQKIWKRKSTFWGWIEFCVFRNWFLHIVQRIQLCVEVLYSFLLIYWSVGNGFVLNFILQTDVGALYSQLKELQKKNAEMEERNKILSSKVFVSFFSLQEIRFHVFLLNSMYILCGFSFKQRKWRMNHLRLGWMCWYVTSQLIFGKQFKVCWHMLLWMDNRNKTQCHLWEKPSRKLLWRKMLLLFYE